MHPSQNTMEVIFRQIWSPWQQEEIWCLLTTQRMYPTKGGSQRLRGDNAVNWTSHLIRKALYLPPTILLIRTPPYNVMRIRNCDWPESLVSLYLCHKLGGQNDSSIDCREGRTWDGIRLGCEQERPISTQLLHLQLFCSLLSRVPFQLACSKNNWW